MLSLLGERKEVWNFQVGRKTCHKVILKVPLLLAVRGIEVLWFPGGISVNKNVDFSERSKCSRGKPHSGQMFWQIPNEHKKGGCKKSY